MPFTRAHGRRTATNTASDAGPPLHRSSVATTREAEQAQQTLAQRRAVPGWSHPLVRSSRGLLAPYRLGFASHPRLGSARGPSPSHVQPERESPRQRRLSRHPPLRGRHRSDTEASARLNRRRGSSSEEPSPATGAHSELCDNVACPGDRREAATTTATPKRRSSWADVGFGLRRAFTSAASPEDERQPRRTNATSAARTIDVAIDGDPVTVMRRIHLRGGTWL